MASISQAKAEELHKLYKNTLLNDIIPFWSKNSPDREHGGYFTCLDTQGKVFDTDKFVWLQAREVWMYSKLYNSSLAAEVSKEEKDSWLDLATLGAHFLRDYAHDEEGNYYFSVTREGKPIIHPYNIFSDCFACMAFAQYAKASGKEWALDAAKKAFENVERRKDNPKGHWSKAYPGTRPYGSLAVPMIDINLCSEMKEVFPGMDVDTRIDDNLKLILDKFMDRERGFFRENVAMSDDVSTDTFEARLVNPGHTIECAWFIMDVAAKRKDKALIDTMASVLLKTLEFGWDNKHEGIFYFMDMRGKPPQQLEWDQKLWWVHLETLVALSLAYRETGRQEFAAWYMKVHAYAWSHFSDPANGEWFGYLNRAGDVLLELKGGKWKGFFHVPRAMFLCADIFASIANKPQL
eukprot:TRINITY_DN14458_c0_g1_i1.p1 TRINITY_DN14458_c0_g1~~TRINITY_DN14458_c0_g1_i1.p1  ORF type:complete len:407 (+),score=114.15 TRINITY_DN14458_c0_g1_i1:29-1249(+)